MARFPASRLTVAVAAVVLLLGGGYDAQQQNPLDQLLTDYRNDPASLRRVFTTSRVLQERLKLREPKELQRWLASWDPARAVVLIELSALSSEIAPQFLPVFARAGRMYAATVPMQDGPDATAGFVRTWHRAAVGLMLGARMIDQVIGYVGDFAPELRDGHAPTAGVDARLALGRATAHERRCWNDRPSRDQPSPRFDALTKAAGVRVQNEHDGPRRALRAARVEAHAACVKGAIARFDEAAALPDARAEARVRAGWLLVQAGRHAEALQRLDDADPRDDRELAYWRALFRGRALGSMGRHGDAAASFNDALKHFPGAQTAGIGIAIELLRADRTVEADEHARAVRAAQSSNPVDPWATYLDGDRRFVDGWIDELRRAIQ